LVASAGYLTVRRTSAAWWSLGRVIIALFLLVALAMQLSSIQAEAAEQDVSILTIVDAAGDKGSLPSPIVHKGAHCYCQHSDHEVVAAIVERNVFQTVRYPAMDSLAGLSLSGLPPLRPPSS
jgi:hypothetical protein